MSLAADLKRAVAVVLSDYAGGVHSLSEDDFAFIDMAGSYGVQRESGVKFADAADYVRDVLAKSRQDGRDRAQTEMDLRSENDTHRTFETARPWDGGKSDLSADVVEPGSLEPEAAAGLEPEPDLSETLDTRDPGASPLPPIASAPGGRMDRFTPALGTAGDDEEEGELLPTAPGVDDTDNSGRLPPGAPDYGALKPSTQVRPLP